MPDTVPTVMVVEPMRRLINALLNVQLPVLAVTQLALPPGEKLPVTVALATTAVVVQS